MEPIKCSVGKLLNFTVNDKCYDLTFAHRYLELRFSEHKLMFEAQKKNNQTFVHWT